MNFSDEEYVRLYTTDSVTWEMLPWQSLALLALALRKFDRSGVFEFGRHGAVKSLALKTRLPIEVVSIGLDAIVTEGIWLMSESQINWPTYIEAQTCRRSDRQRKRAERARTSGRSQVTSCPTEDSICDTSHNLVTKRDASHESHQESDKCRNLSQPVTPGEARRGEARPSAVSGSLDQKNTTTTSAKDLSESARTRVPGAAAEAVVGIGQTNRKPEAKTEPTRQSAPAPRPTMPSGTNGLVPRTSETPPEATHAAPEVRSARPGATSEETPTSAKVPCPGDLKLTQDQRATLESSLIPGWAIDELTKSFVSSAVADPSDTRPLVAWRKCLAKAICSNWNNTSRRPQKPAEQASQGPAYRLYTLAELEAEEIRRGHTLPPRKRIVPPKRATDSERLTFEQYCERTGLDPKTTRNPLASLSIGGDEIKIAGTKG